MPNRRLQRLFLGDSLPTCHIYGVPAACIIMGGTHRGIEARLLDPSRFLLWAKIVHFLFGAERPDPLQGKPVPRRRLVDPKLPKHDEVNLRLGHIHNPLKRPQRHLRTYYLRTFRTLILPFSADSPRPAGVSFL